MGKTLVLSVHQLVDFLLREGDIDTRVFNRSSMNEGSKIHSWYQASQTKGYISEYPLKSEFLIDDIEITLQGRADGIIHFGEEYIIDEIKSTVMDLNIFFEENKAWHLGQAICYAYMFAKEQKLESMRIRLTYIKQGKEKDKLVREFSYKFIELENYVLDLLDQYIDFYNIVYSKITKRNKSIKECKFPFNKFRKGQKDMSVAIYENAKNGGLLFIEAPTGIGKTMSSLYPTLKAMSDYDDSKIFYLTAKTSGRESASNAISLLKMRGLEIGDIVITAKDKICFSKGKACNPEECPFCKNYYSKIQSVLRYSLLNYSSFDYDSICEIAYDNLICPFEFQLDLSLFMDVIICDYNYMFDPNSYMKRYFDEDCSKYYALVDEAHNLVQRSKDMYSASISLSMFENLRKHIRHFQNKKVKNLIKRTMELFQEFDELEDGNTIVDNFSDSTYLKLQRFIDRYQEYSKDTSIKMPKEVIDLYIEINTFMKISEFYSEKYISYIEKSENDIVLRLFCLDPSRYIRNRLKQVKSATIFSATMSPIEYYMNTLGGKIDEDKSLILPSPFNQNNLLIAIAPKVSIKYKNRDASYSQVVEYIKEFVSVKVGNYFVYVPSYEYLEKIKDLLEFDIPVDLYFQTKDMNDSQRQEFIERFQSSPSVTTIGFAVIGGAFSEGIDLVSDRLIGAVIVGVGMPRINFESDQVKKYYDELEMSGYNYAYLNPGMNKVMQAVGRVIRSEEDKGAVLLIDERYTYLSYKALFKDEWSHYKLTFNPLDLRKKITNFFKK